MILQSKAMGSPSRGWWPTDMGQGWRCLNGLRRRGWSFPDGLKMDIATTRRESYAQPAVLPTVQPASIEEDLSRRDFTINAIAVQLNPRQFGRLLDPYGGQRDLRARTIRVLHAGSFQDDPTRIFRAIRFEQRFGFRLERTTVRLLAQAASTNLIQQLSGPRLQNEILLLFAEHDPVRAIARLGQLKLLRFLHRRLCYTKNVKRAVTAVPKALAWWARRFPGFCDRQADRLSHGVVERVQPGRGGRDDPAVSAFTRAG